MIEVHPNPAKALSDGPQSLTPERFDRLMREELAVIAQAVGRWPQVAVGV
jgi:3-deoxy-7-phosphoheptulonate synthase